MENASSKGFRAFRLEDSPSRLRSKSSPDYRLRAFHFTANALAHSPAPR